MSGPRSARALAGAALGVAAVAVAVVSPAPPSAAAGSFTATADARLLAVDLTTEPGVLFDQLVDAGYEVAQAQLDSLGGSTGFASNPYPSETVVLLPGLLASLSAGGTSDVVPPYPLIATSAHPLTPDDRLAAGPVVLEASSRAAGSRAQAADGAGRSVAEVGYDEGTDTVVARAETSLASVPVSSALTLHGLRSVAEVRRTSAGDLERTSSFEIAAVTILGQRIALGAGGLELAGGVVPVAGGVDALLGPLLDAVAAQGTTIELLPAVETADGIVSAGIRISNTSVPPPEVAAGVERVRSAVTFGAASASVSGRAFVDVAGPTPDVAVPVPDRGALDGGGSSSPSAPAAPGGVATGGAVAAAPVAPASVDAGPARSIASVAADISVAGFYPVLVVAGLVLVAIVNLFRRFAVRTP